MPLLGGSLRLDVRLGASYFSGGTPGGFTGGRGVKRKSPTRDTLTRHHMEKACSKACGLLLKEEARRNHVRQSLFAGHAHESTIITGGRVMIIRAGEDQSESRIAVGCFRVEFEEADAGVLLMILRGG